MCHSLNWKFFTRLHLHEWDPLSTTQRQDWEIISLQNRSKSTTWKGYSDGGKDELHSKTIDYIFSFPYPHILRKCGSCIWIRKIDKRIPYTTISYSEYLSPRSMHRDISMLIILHQINLSFQIYEDIIIINQLLGLHSYRKSKFTDLFSSILRQ